MIGALNILYLTDNCFLKEKRTKYVIQQDTKDKHLKDIFLYILKNGTATRATLAKTLRISAPAVSSLVDEEIKMGLLNEYIEGKNYNVGRPPVTLKVNNSVINIPVIIFKRSGFKFTLYDLSFNELETFFVPYISDFTDGINYDENIVTPPKLIPTNIVVDSIIDILDKRSKIFVKSKMNALIISFPGNICEGSKFFVSIPMRAQISYDVLEKLQKYYDNKPLLFGNDSLFYAYAERNFNNTSLKDNKQDDLIFININIGIGAGIIYNGELVTDLITSEIGHITINYNGVQCQCGSRGCLERYININILINEVKNEIKNGRDSEVIRLVNYNINALSLNELRLAYENNDELVCEIIKKAAEQLAFGISNMVSIFTIKNIIIGGGIETLGNKFLETVIAKSKVVGLRQLMNDIHISYPQKGVNGESIGAIRYYIEKYLKIDN
ncbi:MAG: hypothetical protein A2Y17_06535 [Clostridiales bacterium GWF2_38_85]|nr:MAG: hypothetical protein A2Y17_06535 [Clostridiales bacterium GWF2_38_85]HBL84490.1 hypothetical protein [Clostridiales bacterium]